MNLSKKQKEIVETDENKVVVIASAGSGKTRVLTERVKYLLEKGYNPSKIVVITFTNAAAEEMKERLEGKAKDCFIGTIHSYANYILSCSGYDTSKYLDNEKFDELFDVVLRHPECVRDVEMLLLDEAQDSTEQQFEFMFDIVNPRGFFVVGDFRQSIYGFNGGDPDLMIRLSERSDVVKYDLNENYRNASQILSYAKEFLEPLAYRYYDNSVAMSKEYGQVYRFEYGADKIGHFILDNEDDFGTWFVLGRTNALVDEIKDTFDSMGIPCETFKKAELTNSELKERMKNNTVKVLTIHTAKGLEAPNVAVAGAKFFNEEERRVNYVAATRAEKLLVWCLTPKRRKARREVLDTWE